MIFLMIAVGFSEVKFREKRVEVHIRRWVRGDCAHGAETGIFVYHLSEVGKKI